ncbi:hypothetical protein SteCoe_11365 [Stentor coeruleus]|uniref:V-SNARE coiled-coil homology domain-containing protein n=1 Tax=Stentor coeruleus TaxID=5963 RepID=A0A1R2CD84_9CILI|nr:hypothetical protein SteCoe_11365 [Stentor coeruleus]
MKIYAVYIISCAPPFNSEGSYLSCYLDFPKKFIIHKKTIEETCRFLGKTLTVYCQPGSRTTAEHEGMLINVMRRTDDLACVVFTDMDYPKRISYALCVRAAEHFEAKYSSRWRNAAKDSDVGFKELKNIVKEFENPSNHDAVARAIEATTSATEVVTQTLNKIIIRGETLQDIVEKSEELSLRAKIFYKETKKKKCCVIF